MYRFSEITIPPKEFLMDFEWGDEPVRFWWDSVFWQIEIQEDRDPDLSFYGSYSSKADNEEYWGDRKTGNLYGPLVEESRIFETEEEAQKFLDEIERDADRQIYWTNLSEEDSETGTVYEVAWTEYELLSTDGPANWERNSYEYYIPNSNHIPPGNPKNWGDSVSKEYPSNKEADIAYIIQDWNRLESYGNSWQMIGWVAIAFADPLYREELGEASIWGVEWEWDERDEGRYAWEVLQNTMDMALEQVYGDLRTEQWPPNSEPLLYLISKISAICNVAQRINPDDIVGSITKGVDTSELRIHLSCLGDLRRHSDFRNIETQIDAILDQMREFGFETTGTQVSRITTGPQISIWLTDKSNSEITYKYNLILEFITHEWIEEFSEVEIPPPSQDETPILRRTSIWQQIRRREYPEI